MKPCILLAFILFSAQVFPTEVTNGFDAHAGKSGTAHKVPVDSDMYFGCELNIDEYRNDGKWGPSLSLHFIEHRTEEVVAIHLTRSQDDFLVFRVTHREKRINDYDERVLVLKDISDAIIMSMTWSNKVMYFDITDNAGQSSKFFLLVPNFSPEEATLSISGAKGTYRCNDQKI